VARLLAGWRDVPPADRGALVQVLTALSQLLADEPRIAEIDINPLLADAQGVLALDARVRRGRAAASVHAAPKSWWANAWSKTRAWPRWRGAASLRWMLCRVPTRSRCG
jgi:hypothetical protein